MVEFVLEDVVNLLKEQVKFRGGSQKAVADELGISSQYLSDILRYRRGPGVKVLSVLGLRKRVTYIFWLKEGG